jgi:tetratricopeptide (TPR) repeat protein
MTFFSELRRRKVVRVAVAYGIAAFVVLQLADLVLEPLGLPPWAMTLVIVLVALGFPPALILAWAFEWTPEGVRREAAIDRMAPVDPGRARWPLTHRIVVVGAGVVLALAGGAFLTLRGADREPAVSLDPSAVAVMPFRIAADPSLFYLGHGMVDLLSAKLTGEGGPRAMDSRAVLRRWEEATEAGAAPLDREGARALARSLGAGQLLLGEIVGAPGQVTISATLHAISAGTAGAPVTVAGPVDSLPLLVDRLVGQLLSVRAGEEGRRLDVLTTASLPALRAYLAGKEAYRVGLFFEAASHFRRALEIDSTFALAGLELGLAATWAEGEAGRAQGLRVAWQGRDRLPPRDRRRLEIGRTANFPELLRGREAMVREDPDDAVAWLFLGESLFHEGPDVGHPDALDQALRAFERAVAIDSIYAPALYHAIEIHARRGDTAQVRRLARAYFHRNAPPAGYRSYIGWRTALALNDEDLLAALRAEGFEGVEGLRLIAFLGQTDALPMSDVELALAALERQASTTEERLDAAGIRALYLLNAGRPARAERVRAAALRLAPGDEGMHGIAVRAAIFGDGDPGAGAAAAAQLEVRVAGPPPTDLDGARRRIDGLCALEERRLAAGDISRTAGTIAAVRAAIAAVQPEDALDSPGRLRLSLGVGVEQCVARLDAWQAALRTGDPRSPEVTAPLARLDSLLATTMLPVSRFSAVGSIIAARLYSARGEPEAALRAIRRRGYWGPPHLLSSLLLEEGRLAEQAGDVAAAVQAYAHYLHLRTDPEPVLQGEVGRVRAELERLRREREMP